MPPNQELSLKTGLLSRYWPRARGDSRDTARSVERAEHLLQNTLQGVMGRHERVLASLTAGTDSRVTLATALASDVAHRLEFFTYFWDNGKWIDRADQRIAREIADDYKLNYSVIDLSKESDVLPGELAILDMNAHREHFRKLAVAYSRRYAGTGVVHLRSNLSEIFRTFYLKKLPTPRPASGSGLAEIYRRSIRKGEEPSDEEWAEAEVEFESMYVRTQFGEASKRYDGRDLMYWEHRMGSWHAQVVLESDVAFDTLSLYNSRATLAALLSVPLSVRMDDGHMHAIIRDADPHLLEYRFNPGPKRVMSNRNGEIAVQEEREMQSWWDRLRFGRPS